MSNNQIPDGLAPDTLKSQWKALPSWVRAASIAAGAVLALLIVWKILPAIAATLGVGALLAILFVPYFIPSIIAVTRHHASKGAIIAVNLLLGWSLVGWLWALIWSLSNANNTQVAPQQIIINNTASTVHSAPSAPVQYQVGDVVNGHRFNGQSWEPVGTYPPAPLG